MSIRNWVRRAATLTFESDAATVFPLLCPVREYEWIPTWECELLHSVSGVIERGCVFRTRFDREEMVWYVADYDPVDFRIVFVNFMPGVAVHRFTISLVPLGPDRTACGIVREITALSPEGAARLDAMADTVERSMHGLETLMNAHLARSPRTAAS
jgi:hypothetical protein